MTLHRLARVPHIVLGRTALRDIGGLAAGLVPRSHTVLLCADPGLQTTGRIEELASLLGANDCRVVVFTDIKSDPSIVQAEAAIAIARRERADLVVALGGGSALDLGKAVAALASGDRPAEAYALGAAPLPSRRLRSICVPTTAGTGSETTRTSILSGPDGTKLWFWGEQIKADAVILDPELAVTLPPGLTAATGIDALVHAVEAATNRNASPANAMYCYEAIRLVGGNLDPAVRNGADLAAREALAWAAALAGIAIDNAGTAVAHTIGHALASLRPIHHGRAVGIAMLAALPWAAEGNEEAFAGCAVALGATPTAAGFIEAYESLLRRTLGDVSLGPGFADVAPEMLAAQMARPENTAMLRSTRREAGPDDLLALARATLALR